MLTNRDTFKYWFKVGELKVHCGITINLEIREHQHRNSGKITSHNGTRHHWSDGRIEQVGYRTTHERALMWLEEKANQNE